MFQSTRKATITLEVPTFKKEQSKNKDGKIISTTTLQCYDVKGMVNIIERQLANYISTSRQIPKPEDKDKTRWDEAIFMLHELRKFYLLDSAGVKTTPEEIK